MSDFTDLLPGTFRVASVRMTLDGFPTAMLEDGRSVKLTNVGELAAILALLGDAEAAALIAQSYDRYQVRERNGENAAARQMVARVMAQADRQDVQEFIRRMGPMTPTEFIAQEVVAPLYSSVTNELTSWRTLTHWSWRRLQELAKSAAETGKSIGKVVLVGGLAVGAIWLVVRASKGRKTKRRRK